MEESNNSANKQALQNQSHSEDEENHNGASEILVDRCYTVAVNSLLKCCILYVKIFLFSELCAFLSHFASQKHSVIPTPRFTEAKKYIAAHF